MLSPAQERGLDPRQRPAESCRPSPSPIDSAQTAGIRTIGTRAHSDRPTGAMRRLDIRPIESISGSRCRSGGRSARPAVEGRSEATVAMSRSPVVALMFRSSDRLLHQATAGIAPTGPPRATTGRRKAVSSGRRRGCGFGALSNCMNSSGLMPTCVVPSLHGVLSFNATCPAALNYTRSSESAGRSFRSTAVPAAARAQQRSGSCT